MEFKNLTAYLDNLDKNNVPSYRMQVYRNHEKLFDYFNATDELYESEKDKKYYYIFSATKVITCTALMQLVENGKIGLDDAVSEYLPEFAELHVRPNYKKAESIMTVRHLMSMQSGLHYGLSDKAILDIKAKTDNKATTRQIAEAISKQELLFEPGTDYNYSLSHDVLAAIIEVVSGMKFSEYLNKNIFEPVGMTDTGFHANEEIMSKMHAQFGINPYTHFATLTPAVCIYKLSDNHESGGAGLYSTVDDYAKFVDALASGETVSGKKLLKPETVEIMKTNQLCEKGLKTYRMTPTKVGYGYGLGVRTLMDRKAASSYAPNGEYGWDGAAGQFNMIDTENHISLVYGQHVLGCTYCYNIVHPALRNLVYIDLGLDIK